MAADDFFDQELCHGGGVGLADGESLGPLGEVVNHDQDVLHASSGDGQGTDDIHAKTVPRTSDRYAAQFCSAMLARFVLVARRTACNIPFRVCIEAWPPVIGRNALKCLEHAMMTTE